MTRTGLLKALKKFTEEAIKELLLPVRQQREDIGEPEPKQAQVFITRLPEMKASDKKAPYIIHSVITAQDRQSVGEELKSTCLIRTVFCVYNKDEEEGGLDLLNLIERLRIALLKQVVVEDYTLDLQEGMELLVFPDDTAPYYLAEMTSFWKLPPIKREVNKIWL